MFGYFRDWSLASLLVLSLMLTGCGQKGNLYLPEIPAAPDVLTSKSAEEDASAQRAKSRPRTEQMSDEAGADQP